MILHLDMDAFFASVEQLDNPELRGKPVIIGGRTRGVVATASYEARRYGIHSAMPVATARRLCPDGIYIRARGKRYSELSHTIMTALGKFSDVVEVASIDEAYLDISDSGEDFGTLEKLARKLHETVFTVSGGLTCSIGIAPVKFLAKICSDINKPAGVFILESDDILGFLADLPIERLSGIGKRLTASLHGIGVRKVAQLQCLSREFLIERYGKIGKVLYERSHGIDARAVCPMPLVKSESAEGTFPVDILDKQQLCKALLRHAEKVSRRLRAKEIEGRTITLKLKYADFVQITRTKTLLFPTNSTSAIYGTARDLLSAENLRQAVRLIGVGVSGFDNHGTPLPLPGLAAASTADPVDRLLDKICTLYGTDALQRASTMLPDPWVG